MRKNAILTLTDGTVFEGTSIGACNVGIGEVVFNTAMTGYQEILTDPSYARQIVTLTVPHVGNTGVNTEDEESAAVHACGLVIRDLPLLSSSFRSQQSLPDYLKQHNIAAIADIDTRRLTRHLREHGAQAGVIDCSANASDNEAQVLLSNFAGLAGMDLAQQVTTEETYDWRQGTWQFDGSRVVASDTSSHVVAFDFGVKRNILRMLGDRGCRVTVVNAKSTAEQVMALKPDGIFLSNGPGDPEPCTYAIDAIRKLLPRGIPVFGICLGHQLLALASGAATVKMKFGHHGANHPVLDLRSNKVMISSQNHGFAVDESSLPSVLRATHRSLFDNTLQGIERTDLPAFSFQGHPEASPGPHDVASLFDRFINLIEKHKQHATSK
ncbi:carbamoyl phosphate synthase small subunit [Chromatiales bacterium (ex Bugula neritina AB1)]|nr:carbamoyl phosphate synthase small subunit [Chromatiales bacterium (ex Bugula neritina AB1)]